MTAMAFNRYELDYFETVISGGFNCILDKNVISNVQAIADQVGAPEYVRTPQFAKKEISNQGRDQGRRRNNKHSHELSDEAWEAIRKFETTQLHKSEGIDKSIDQLRKAINKISDKTYATLSEQLIQELRNIAENGTAENKNKAATILFNIASTNTLINGLCARLYAQILPEFEFLRPPVTECLRNFATSYAAIVYVNPENDYDGFCNNNKINQNRRAIAKFIINMYKQSVLDDDSVSDAIEAIGVAVTKYLLDSDCETGILEELLETVYDLLSVDIKIIKQLKGWSKLKEAITAVTKAQVNDTRSLSHRARFKAMDILDMAR